MLSKIEYAKPTSTISFLMRLSTGKILLLTLSIITVTVSVAVYQSISQSRKVNNSFISISNSQSLLYYAEKLLSATELNEIVVREYILTGDETHLSSLQGIYLSIKDDYDQLNIYVKGDTVLQQKVDSLPFYIRGGKTLSDSIINMRRNEGMAKALQMTMTDTVYSFVFNARALVSRIKFGGQSLLKVQREENARALADFKKIWYIEISLLIIMMIMLAQKLRVDLILGRNVDAAIQYNALLMGHIHDAVISTDKNISVVSWNSKAKAIFGWSEEEMRGKKVLEILKPEYMQVPESVAAKELLKNGSWEGELSFQRKDGERIAVRLSSAIVKMPNGKMKGVVAIVRDISGQKQLEEQLTKFNSELGRQVEDRTLEVRRVVGQLLASEKKHKLLFEHNPLPMWMMALPEMNVTEVNDAAVRQYGYARRAFLKLNVRDIHPQSDVNDFIAYMQAQPSGYHNAGVWRHYRKNRNVIFVEIYAYSMMLDGKEVRLILSHDITQKIEAEKKLKQSLAETRMLSDHLQQVREDERKNIAREIHDELGQELTVLKMDVAWTIKKMNYSDEITTARLKGLLDTIDGTMKSVRRICSELRPALLDDVGLAAAIEWQSAEFEKNSGITIKLSLPAEQLALSPEVKTALFRIFQESLTNIARHAQAQQVQVHLQRKDKSIELIIKDDGKGFDTATLTKKNTLGILGMKERSLAMGGRYTIESIPDEGTIVKAIVPIEKDKII